MAAKRGQGRIVNKRITRGKRKGRTVRGYIGKGGKFTELKANTAKTAGGQQTRAVGKGKVNKAGPRKGLKPERLRSATGQRINRYRVNGKITDVVVAPKKKAAKKKAGTRKRKAS